MQHSFSPPAPLILSLRLDADSFTMLGDLRRRHFPRERNHLDAHATPCPAKKKRASAAI